MSGLNFTPGRKGRLSKLLRNLYYCQTKQQEPPFKGKGFTYTIQDGLFVIIFKTSGTIEFNDFIDVYSIFLYTNFIFKYFKCILYND